MCCFSRPVKLVAGTKIFARELEANRQALVYAMDFEAESDLAMILPLPVPEGADEDAVRFVSLEGYEKFFSDLEAAFPPPTAALGIPRGGYRAAPEPPLEVHDVGLFEASFVPTRRDFARLDPRFRLSENVFGALPAYDTWGFAVFRLKVPEESRGRGTKRRSVHPMAFSFPRRDPNSLFFPTVHVHDGTVPEEARFDHALFCQADEVLDACLDWTHSSGPLGSGVDAERARELVDGALPGRRTLLDGDLPNEDTWLVRPEGVSASDLRGRGLCYAFAARATRANARGQKGNDREARWRETARTRLPALCRGLDEGLRELETSRREAWRLAPLSDDLPPHFVQGSELWAGTSWRDGRPASAEKRKAWPARLLGYFRGSSDDGPASPGRGKVEFSPSSSRVEPQSIVLGFESLPSPALLDEIRGELARLLDRAVSS